MRSPKAFISHASQNFRLADDLRARLEAHGIPCWIAPRDIPAGSSYGEQITAAMQNATAVVLILSSRANASPGVANELELAFRYQKVIIPVRVEPVEPANSLAFYVNNRQWVEACYTPLRQRAKEIAQIITAVTAGSTPPRPTPEQKTLFGALERRLEGMIRYKVLTLTVALTAALGLAGIGMFLSNRNLSYVAAEKDLINADPSTFGLVTLAVSPIREPSPSEIYLQANVYLNLRDPGDAKVDWRAYWSGGGGAARALDMSALGAMRTAGAQVMALAVPSEATKVVFCMTALHPSLRARHTARWSFSVDGLSRPVVISRAQAPTLTAALDKECT